MGGKQFRLEGRLSKVLWWAKSNWQILLFWFAGAFAGWYLGAKGYGMVLYFHTTGINPEEWIPILRLAAEKDPKVGTQVSLDGLTDWNGKPLKFLYCEKMTGLLFICGQCGWRKNFLSFMNFPNAMMRSCKW